MWQPLSEVDLWDKLNQARDRMTMDQRRVGNHPHSAGEVGASAIRKPGWRLLVVGLIGRKVVWYNDIEEGFNRPGYDRYGTISDYYCNQDDLEIAIQGVIRVLQKRRRLRPIRRSTGSRMSWSTLMTRRLRSIRPATISPACRRSQSLVRRTATDQHPGHLRSKQPKNKNAASLKGSGVFDYRDT